MADVVVPNFQRRTWITPFPFGVGPHPVEAVGGQGFTASRGELDFTVNNVADGYRFFFTVRAGTGRGTARARGQAGARVRVGAPVGRAGRLQPTRSLNEDRTTYENREHDRNCVRPDCAGSNRSNTFPPHSCRGNNRKNRCFPAEVGRNCGCHVPGVRVRMRVRGVRGVHAPVARWQCWLYFPKSRSPDNDAARTTP